MKKFKFNVLSLGAEEVLSRSQMKNVLGGFANTNATPYCNALQHCLKSEDCATGCECSRLDSPRFGFCRVADIPLPNIPEPPKP